MSCRLLIPALFGLTCNAGKATLSSTTDENTDDENTDDENTDDENTAGDNIDDDGNDDDTGDSGVEEDSSMWDEATLVVHFPESGAFLPPGEAAAFEAEVLDADGDPLDFDDITWQSDLDSAWSGAGANFEDDSLEAGEHTLVATARLPNGDRLAYAVGGVLVQHEDAGIYVGQILVDVTSEYNGTDVESALIIDLSNDSGTLEGEVLLDLSVFEYGFATTGTLGDDEIAATWSDDVYGYATISGTLEASRISRDVLDSGPPPAAP